MPGSSGIAEAAHTAAGLWADAAGSLRPAGRSANHVYSFDASGTTRYLRLVSSDDRTRGQIEAELDFIAHLRRGGVGAAAPLASRAGRLVEELPHGGGLLFACGRLLEGYSEETTADVSLADLTMFCRWRLVYMFLVYARRWGFENLDGRQAEWFARKRENIARGYAWGA